MLELEVEADIQSAVLKLVERKRHPDPASTRHLKVYIPISNWGETDPIQL